MTALSVNEDRLGVKTTELSRRKSKWHDSNSNRNVFDLFEDNYD